MGCNGEHAICHHGNISCLCVTGIFAEYYFTRTTIFGKISVYYCCNASRNFTITVHYCIINRLGVIYQSTFLNFLLYFIPKYPNCTKTHSHTSLPHCLTNYVLSLCNCHISPSCTTDQSRSTAASHDP